MNLMPTLDGYTVNRTTGHLILDPSAVDVQDYNILIHQPPITRKVGSVELPDDYVTKQSYAQIFGRIVRMSPMAFVHDDWPDDVPTPQIGQLVVFNQHAGDIVGEAADGGLLRVLKDRAVLAVLNAEAGA